MKRQTEPRRANRWSRLIFVFQLSFAQPRMSQQFDDSSDNAALSSSFLKNLRLRLKPDQEAKHLVNNDAAQGHRVEIMSLVNLASPLPSICSLSYLHLVRRLIKGLKLEMVFNESFQPPIIQNDLIAWDTSATHTRTHPPPLFLFPCYFLFACPSVFICLPFSSPSFSVTLTLERLLSLCNRHSLRVIACVR